MVRSKKLPPRQKKLPDDIFDKITIDPYTDAIIEKLDKENASLLGEIEWYKSERLELMAQVQTLTELYENIRLQFDLINNR